FLFTETPPPEPYTLSLHDALPISPVRSASFQPKGVAITPPAQSTVLAGRVSLESPRLNVTPPASMFVTITLLITSTPSRVTNIEDRKSTRLNSSHVAISYAVFCLK